MATAKWTALATESSIIAGTALDSKATGTTTYVADVDNTSGKNLNIRFWLSLGSITPVAGGSVTLILREKVSSTIAENNVVTYTASPTGSGARAFVLAFPMQLPHAGVWSLYWTNSLGVTSAASGNTLTYTTWNEDVT